VTSPQDTSTDIAMEVTNYDYEMHNANDGCIKNKIEKYALMLKWKVNKNKSYTATGTGIMWKMDMLCTTSVRHNGRLHILSLWDLDASSDCGFSARNLHFAKWAKCCVHPCLLCSLLAHLFTADWLMTCRPAIWVFKGASIGYGQQKEVGTPSLWLLVCLGVEHWVNFEVNL